MQFGSSEKKCRVQQNACFGSPTASLLPLGQQLCSAFYVEAQIYHQKTFFMKPNIPLQRLIRQITPRRSLQSFEVENKVMFLILIFSPYEDQQFIFLTESIWEMCFPLLQMMILLLLFQLRTDRAYQVNEVDHQTGKNQLTAPITLRKQVMSEFRPRNALLFHQKKYVLQIKGNE